MNPRGAQLSTGLVIDLQEAAVAEGYEGNEPPSTKGWHVVQKPEGTSIPSAFQPGIESPKEPKAASCATCMLKPACTPCRQV